MSFSNTESQSRDDKVFRSPASWDLEALQQNWLEQLQVLAEENEISVPLERLRVQVEQTPVYQEVFQRWDKMDGLTRLQSWKRLLDASEKQMGDILPSCLQCGDCCRRGSPSLHVEDMELLHEGKIPWSRLVTLRRGEPVRSPYNGKVFHLMDERIKLAEKPGTRECVFLDEADNQCTIYSIRPVQCRAQACWDPKQAQQLAEQPYLTRRDVFKQIELLLELIAKHDEQCAFSKLGEAFERLKQSQGENVGEVLELLAYEDHFRRFLAEQLNIPDDTLELVFGRSFADMAPLFGFKVVVEEDGSRRLEPDQG